MKERILLSFAGGSGVAMGLSLLAVLAIAFALIEYRQAKHGLPY